MNPDARIYPKTAAEVHQLLQEARQLPRTSPRPPRSMFDSSLSLLERSKGYEMFSTQVARIRQFRQEDDSLRAGN